MQSLLPQAHQAPEEQGCSVCIVGSGTRFLSGISYYTLRLTNALARTHRTSTILMRQLLPTLFYPGKRRVGVDLTHQQYHSHVHVFDGVDWYWLPSLFKAIVFLLRERPKIVVFQWWTGTVLHSFLALAAITRLIGAKVVIEFHEVQDTGEANIPLARTYVGLLAPLLMRLASGFVIHSEYDRPALQQRYALGNRPVAVIPHGPYDHHRSAAEQKIYRVAPDADCCNLLFFGVIRPFKGLEDLIAAFDAIPADEIDGYWLTVVGETWEGWTLPSELIAQSRYRDRITFVNRYVHDEEVAEFFACADAVVLPYHRSSASGPLHTAMSWGLPLVTTRVGGLVEAVERYDGAILAPPKDPAELCCALGQVATLRGKRFADPHSWESTCEQYDALFDAILREQVPTPPVSVDGKAG
ncbi:MAG: glycosyltransferase family 4 protein [Chloroflexales bacterium]|nr:glycosyltransferase family 4 protein [Chloroflexales bacterium]